MILNKAKILDFIITAEWELFDIKEVKEKNLLSRAQQKFYWWVVVDIISNYHGITPLETHLAIKTTFNLETTTDLSKKEFKDLIELIQELWKSKFNVEIPSPSDIKGEESLFKTLWF